MAANGRFGEMNRQEKIECINNELRILQQCCVNHNLSSCQIKKTAKVFLSEPKHAKESKLSFQTLLKFSVVVGVFGVVFYCSPVNRFITASTRLARISVLPLFDWRVLHNIGCLVENPHTVGQERQLQAKDCVICSNLTGVRSLLATGMEDISESFLKKDLPVTILEDHQKIIAEVSINDLTELYLEDEILRLYSCCEFESNVDIPMKNHRALLIGIRDGKYSNYYAHWQNCFKDAAKLFRQAYRRPELLPTTVELVETNWVFVSSHYKGDNYIQMPLEHPVMILMQLSGHIDVILKPKDICEHHCKILTYRLRKGSTMILTDLLFDIEYRPCGTDSAVTVGLGGDFDP